MIKKHFDAKDTIQFKITEVLYVEFWNQWLGTQRMTYLIEMLELALILPPRAPGWLPNYWENHPIKRSKLYEFRCFVLGLGVVVKYYRK